MTKYFGIFGVNCFKPDFRKEKDTDLVAHVDGVSPSNIQGSTLNSMGNIPSSNPYCRSAGQSIPHGFTEAGSQLPYTSLRLVRVLSHMIPMSTALFPMI
jgi:hypothetical protein